MKANEMNFEVYENDLEISRALSTIVGAKPKECYTNSFETIFIAKKNYPNSTLKYAEGYGLSKHIGIPILHGFIMIVNDAKTVVIDVTWTRDCDECLYVPLYTFTIDEVWKLKRNRGGLTFPLSEFHMREIIRKFPEKLPSSNFQLHVNAIKALTDKVNELGW